MAKQIVDSTTKELPLEVAWSKKGKVEVMLREMIQVTQKMQAEYNALHTQAVELEVAGVDYAGTTWKDGKYLYLVYPVAQDGTRKRVYIGADKAKIDAVEKRLERGLQLVEVKRQIWELDAHMGRMENILHMYMRNW